MQFNRGFILGYFLARRRNVLVSCHDLNNQHITFLKVEKKKPLSEFPEMLNYSFNIKKIIL